MGSADSAACPLQCPSKHQVTIHGVLGIPMHKIAVRTKRIGGGFGGKESRSAFVNAAIAVPAWHLRRPVRVVLDRDEDMQIMGQRHAFVGHYKVRFRALGFNTPCIYFRGWGFRVTIRAVLACMLLLHLPDGRKPGANLCVAVHS